MKTHECLLPPSPVYSAAQWNALLERTLETIKHLAAVKGGEYAPAADRLANFRRNGAKFGVPSELVWGIYAGKHFDAIATYIGDIVSGTHRPRSEPIEGRADDLIVYLILFKAMLEERAAVDRLSQ